jgi:hypothetical protein
MQDKEFVTIILIVSGIVILGMYLKNNISDKKHKELINEVLKKKTELTQPYHENIYNSNRINEVNEELLDKSLANYEKALKPSETGFIPPYFALPQSGSTFYDASGEDKSSFEKTLDKVVTEFSTEERSQIREFNILDTGLKTVDRAARGDVRKMPMFESFTDQVENTPENLKETKFTEFKDTFFHKVEQGPMFPRVKQDIYGTPMITENVEMDRFIPSNYRQNERPFEPLRIPAPIAGTIENEIRPVYKTVNELRPGNKPKLSYEGRIVDGQKGELRTEYGEVQKQNPLREAEMGYEEFIKGQSNFRKPKFSDKDNYIPVLKDTGRMYSEEISASGPARTDFGVRQYLVKEEDTTNFTPME